MDRRRPGRTGPNLDEEIGRIVLALIDEVTSVPGFLVAASALRQRLAKATTQATASAVESGATACPPLGPADPRVDAVVSRLLQLGPGCRSLYEVDVAREVAVDPAHLGRLLRSHTGWTFRQWRFGICLRAACRSLADCRTPIKVVALKSGFASSQAFARVFRKNMSLTPTQFRGMVVDRPAGQEPAGS